MSLGHPAANGHSPCQRQLKPASCIYRYPNIDAKQMSLCLRWFVQDRPLSSLRFRTTCNLSLSPLSYFKDDSAFEVDEEAWEEEGLVDLVFCLEVYPEEVMPSPSSRPSGVDGESGQDSLQPEEEHVYAQVHKRDRDFDEQEDGEGESVAVM